MSNREIDALVAEKVMGWSAIEEVSPALPFIGQPPERDEPGFYVPAFTTDPRSDYDVLCKVREKWEGQQQGDFALAVYTIWHSRQATSLMAFAWPALLYEPGDYSIAALKALGVEVEATP